MKGGRGRGGNGGGGGRGGEEMSPNTSEGSVGVEVVRVKEEEGKVVKGLEPENEFMLDGFDFSTSEREDNVHF